MIQARIDLLITDSVTDEKLEIFQMMVELNEQTMGSMATATRDFESFLKDFDIIRKDMQSFQMSLNEGIVEITELLEKHWSDIRGNVQDLDHAILSTLEVNKQFLFIYTSALTLLEISSDYRRS